MSISFFLLISCTIGTCDSQALSVCTNKHGSAYRVIRGTVPSFHRRLRPIGLAVRHTDAKGKKRKDFGYCKKDLAKPS